MHEPCYTLDEVAEMLDTRVYDLLCGALNGDLILSADFFDMVVPARQGVIEKSESDEFSDRIVYENTSMLPGVSGVWDLYLPGSFGVIQRTADHDLRSSFGGLHFKAWDGTTLIEIQSATGREAQRLPEGAKWVIRKSNLPLTQAKTEKMMSAEKSALADIQQQAQDAAESDKSGGNPEGNVWEESARLIADELDAQDKKSRCHDSLKGMSERVATEMRNQEIYGPRGPLSAGTILRQALQGKKWKRRA